MRCESFHIRVLFESFFSTAGSRLPQDSAIASDSYPNLPSDVEFFHAMVSSPYPYDTVPTLPSDIIFEILSRTTSLQTLYACKCVSKQWRDLIYDPSFTPIYLNMSGNCSRYFIQDIVYDVSRKSYMPYSTFASPEPLRLENGEYGHVGPLWKGEKILASCNRGIALWEGWCHYNHVTRFSVSIFGVRYWEWLPKPSFKLEPQFLGIVVLGRRPFWYKVVRLLLSIDNVIRYDIFDSKVRMWRRGESYVVLPQSDIITDTIPAVSVGNSVYWLTYKDNVIAFNGLDQSLDKFRLPNPVTDEYKRIQEFHGRLGFVGLKKDGEIELWLVKSFVNHEWNKRMMVDIKVVLAKFQFTCVGFHNEASIYIKALDEMVFYDVKSGSIMSVNLDCELRHATEIFSLRSGFNGC